MSRLNRIGRYHVDEVWREEAAGRIVRARDPRGEGAVLITELFLPPEPDPQRALRAEALHSAAEALARVSHPSVARPCDLGETETSFFAVFQRPDPSEYRPLSDVYRSLGVEELVAAAGQATEALAALVAASAAPPRFCPEFVLRSRSGAVKLLPLELTVPLAAGEPPPHAPPAGLSGAGALAYSVAAWLYLALAPGAAPPREQAEQGRGPEPLWTLNPSVRAAVDEALQNALAPGPVERSLQDLARALRSRAAANPAPPPAPPADPMESEPELPRWLLYGGWAGMALAGSLAGWILAQAFPAR